MLDKSLFASDQIHEREIVLADGKKHKLYFKELPHGHFRQYALDNESDNEQVRIDSMSRLVSEGLVTKDGKRALTLAQARNLKPGPLIAIFNAIQEVNSSFKKKTVSGDSGTS